MRRSKSYWPVSVTVSDEKTLESLEAFLSRAGFSSSRLCGDTLIAEDYTPRVVNRPSRNRASRSLGLFLNAWTASHPEIAITTGPYQPHSREGSRFCLQCGRAMAEPGVFAPRRRPQPGKPAPEAPRA